MGNNKSQIALFVIIGIIFIISLIYILISNSTVGNNVVNPNDLQSYQEQNNINSFVTNCLSKSLVSAVQNYGYRDLTLLEYHINHTLINCTGNFSSYPYLSITKGNTSFSLSNYYNESLTVTMDYPLTIKSSNEEIKLETFYSKLALTDKITVLDNTSITSISLLSPDQNALLSINPRTVIINPSGSFPFSIEVDLEDVTLYDNTLAISYDFKPDGLTFDPYATIKLKYNDEDNDSIVDGTNINENNLVIKSSQNGVWVTLDSEVYPIGNYVTANIFHFSEYAIGENVSSNANVYSVNPSLTPDLIGVELTNLFDPNVLNGTYVELSFPIYSPSPRPGCDVGDKAEPTNGTFIFEPISYGDTNYFSDTYEGQHFDEVMIYYGYTTAGEKYNSLGITVQQIKVVLFDMDTSADQVGTMEGNTGGAGSMIVYPYENSRLHTRNMMTAYHETTHAAFNQVIDPNFMTLNDHASLIVKEGFAMYMGASLAGTAQGYEFGYRGENFMTDYVYSPATTTDETEQIVADNTHALAGALWDIRSAIGADVFDPIVISSWRGYVSTGDPISDVYTSLVNAGGSHSATISKHLKAHGIN